MILGKKVLIVAAHPDDEILGCGGIMSKYKNKIEFKVLFLGEGSSSRISENKPQKILDAIYERRECAIRALKKFNIDQCHFHNLACGKFDKYEQLDINQIIEKHIDQFKPNTVLTHSSGDVNSDHIISYKSVLASTRPLKKRYVENVITFEVLSSTHWNYTNVFQPNYFENLNHKNIKEKVEGFEIYESEVHKFPHPRSEEGIISLAKFRGSQSHQSYSEAFQIIRHYQK